MSIDPVVAALAGIIGTVLAWFMGRAERRLDRVDIALSRFSKVLLLEIVSRAGVSPAVAKEAGTLITELDRDRDRKGGNGGGNV